MGRQYGERAADLIRMVYEGWYRELIAKQGTTENMLGYLHEQKTYYEALLPEGLEFMHGIAVVTQSSDRCFQFDLRFGACGNQRLGGSGPVYLRIMFQTVIAIPTLMPTTSNSSHSAAT
jgi:hypothetical protein